jgi:DNA mismatch endonuclease (patch repair protein)
MKDRLTKAQRSRNMARIRAKDTKPELIVRSLVHRMGYRFRLHRRDLPGTPDLVFPRLKAVIFVNGCFWHRHSCANGKVVPRTRRKFWVEKFAGNKLRDRRNRQALVRLGWKVLVLWECDVKMLERDSESIRRFLAS